MANLKAILVAMALGIGIFFSPTAAKAHCPHSTPPENEPHCVGQFTPFEHWDARTIHTIMLPTGEVLWWAWGAGQKIYLWDPVNNETVEAANRPENLFCSGTSFLPDGRLLVSGGHIANEVGLNTATIYDPYFDFWTTVPAMTGGRWYPSSTTLANGDVPGWTPEHLAVLREIRDEVAATV